MNRPHDKPALKGHSIRRISDGHQSYLVVSHRYQLTDQQVVLKRSAGVLLYLMDGTRTIEDIADEAYSTHGVYVSASTVAELVTKLDELCVLASPQQDARMKQAIADYRAKKTRSAICAGGTYSDDPTELQAQIHKLFEQSGGPGWPTVRRDGKLAGAVAPHMDYYRGQLAYPWAFHALAEQGNQPTLVFIIATSHYSDYRFILTQNDFATPLGIVKTSQKWSRFLVEQVGEQVFDDELAHIPEHSIELELPFLQLLLGEEFEIVPLLVGSFVDASLAESDPADIPEIAAMIKGLRETRHAAQKAGERVFVLVSGDLAHIGPKFGDPWKIDDDRRDWCRNQDDDYLKQFATGNAASLAQFVASETDKRRICGFPPTYTALSAMEASSGETLKYDLFRDPNEFEIVSFASMAIR